MCGSPLKSNAIGVSLDSDGFPSRLQYLKEYIDSKDPLKLRGVLTLMYLSRIIVPTKEELRKIKPNFDSITGEFTGKENFTIPDDFIQNFVRKFKLKSELPTYGLEDHYISTKGSPTGKGATLRAALSL
jgi:hypothetical protein